jgi:hypothetical protein
MRFLFADDAVPEPSEGNGVDNPVFVDEDDFEPSLDGLRGQQHARAQNDQEVCAQATHTLFYSP